MPATIADNEIMPAVSGDRLIISKPAGMVQQVQFVGEHINKSLPSFVQSVLNFLIAKRNPASKCQHIYVREFYGTGDIGGTDYQRFNEAMKRLTETTTVAIRDEKTGKYTSLLVSWIPSPTLRGLGGSPLTAREFEFEFDEILLATVDSADEERISYEFRRRTTKLSKYTIPLKELLLSHAHDPQPFVIELNNLAANLDALPKLNERFGIFNRDVLKIAQQQINDEGKDLTFEYQKVLTGKKVTGVAFYITLLDDQVRSTRLELFKKADTVLVEDKSEMKQISSLSYDHILDTIRDQIGYEKIVLTFDETSKQAEQATLDMIVDIITEVYCSTSKTFWINKCNIPKETVKSRFAKLTENEIREVLISLKKRAKNVENPRTYVLTTLFNVSVNAKIQLGTNTCQTVAERQYDDEEIAAIKRLMNSNI